MAEIFISYASATVDRAKQIADTLRALGYGVWRDDELPAHRAYGEVIEERLRSARAVVVIWSASAVKSQWVRAEADLAREAGKLVQLRIDEALLPLPFNQIQCADLTDWSGDADAPGWRKVTASIAELFRGKSQLAEVLEPASTSPPQVPTKPSLAVLPFANLSGEADQEYFADGMVVEIVAALSRIKSIFVIASGSSLTFKNKGLTPQDVARQLGVRYILEGSIRKAGGRVRIVVQLVDAHARTQIWTHRFEDTLDDIFALQDRVALNTAATIEPAVREADARRSSARPTENMGSYDLFLRALAMMRTYTGPSMFEVLGLVERAIKLDPNFGAALAVCARCHYLIVLYGWSDDPDHHRRQALEMGHRAIRAASDDAFVLSHVAALIAYLERDVVAALDMVDRALVFNPGSSMAFLMSGAVRVLTAELDLAIEHLSTSQRLDPVGPDRAARLIFIAMVRFQQRRFADAIALGKELSQYLDNPTGCAILAASYGHLRQSSAGQDALAHYKRLTPQSLDAYARLVWQRTDQLKLFTDGIALLQIATT
jgi:adenylate cyclase